MLLQSPTIVGSQTLFNDLFYLALLSWVCCCLPCIHSLYTLMKCTRCARYTRQDIHKAESASLPAASRGVGMGVYLHVLGCRAGIGKDSLHAPHGRVMTKKEPNLHSDHVFSATKTGFSMAHKLLHWQAAELTLLWSSSAEQPGMAGTAEAGTMSCRCCCRCGEVVSCC